jgi:hypothetical protein
MHNDVVRVDVHIGKNTQNGPSVVTLYQRTLSLPSEICCRLLLQNMKGLNSS